jgi:hypothetical protein
MNIPLKAEMMQAMFAKFPENPVFDLGDRGHWYNHSIDSKFLSPLELDALEAALDTPENTQDAGIRRTLRNIRALKTLLAGKADKIVKLEAMAEAVRLEIATFPKHWVFSVEPTDGIHVPYFVASVEYMSSTRNSPAHVLIHGMAIRRGKKDERAWTVYRSHLGKHGTSVPTLFQTLGLLPETKSLVEDHEEQIRRYVEFSAQTGLQLTGSGMCVSEGDRWSRCKVQLGKSGHVTKLVVDDAEDRGNESTVVSTSTWSTKHDEDGDEAEDVCRVPVHPYLRAFSLESHEFIVVHVRNTEKYVYEKGLEDKLVLSPDRRELIDLLVSSGGDDSRDIVQGKSGGVVIITSGPPGTGKTLSAEVYAEKVERPLYVVQCSQLGTCPDALEKKLQEVLERAIRWNAILLIDEADVYIHERGADIQQNAVVGVFLRLLEYYSGVLFLTTNRATIIDDAIVSRAIAHVRYAIPTAVESEMLWDILSTQYGVTFSPATCRVLAERFKGVSGRSIKQLIRLGKALAQSRKEPLTVDTIAWVSKFQNIELNGDSQK